MFITFEGIEGCGKSTQILLLRDYLVRQGRKVVLTREPGGSALGQPLRRILLGPEGEGTCALAELFLYLADRAQHVHEVIVPALDAGSVVLCDRFTDSTLVYQGAGRGLDADMLHSLNQVAVRNREPDLTLILDLPVETGLDRARGRNAQSGLTVQEGRFEAESLAFHRRVRQGYQRLAAAHPKRCALIPGDGSVEQVAALIQDRIGKALNPQQD